jgi:hypothetical protein
MIDDSRAKQPKRRQSGEQSREQSGNGVDSETRKHLARMLKATYDEVAHEPVPDKFLDLLKQLEKAEPGKQ